MISYNYGIQTVLYSTSNNSTISSQYASTQTIPAYNKPSENKGFYGLTNSLNRVTQLQKRFQTTFIELYPVYDVTKTQRRIATKAFANLLER